MFTFAFVCLNSVEEVEARFLKLQKDSESNPSRKINIVISKMSDIAALAVIEKFATFNNINQFVISQITSEVAAKIAAALKNAVNIRAVGLYALREDEGKVLLGGLKEAKHLTHLLIDSCDESIENLALDLFKSRKEFLLSVNGEEYDFAEEPSVCSSVNQDLSPRPW